MKHKKTSGVLMCLGLLSLLVSALFALYNVWDMQRAGESAHQVMTQLEEVIPERKLSPVKIPVGAADIPEQPLEVPDYLLVPDMEMPEQMIEGTAYIGVLEIPDLALSLPVASSWSYPQLRNTPCRYVGSAYSDDMVIAAHNYAQHFGNLGKLYLDSEILFTDVQGNVFQYRVSEFETLQPTAIAEMTGYNGGITLFTCTLGGQTRFTLRAVRVEE